MATLKVGDLQMQADGWAAAQSAAAAVRYVRPVLKWVAQRGYAPDELALITPPATVRRRKRIQTRDELAALLPVLRASSRPYFRRLFLTRLIELHAAGRLAFFGTQAGLTDRRVFLRHLARVRQKRFMVYAKPPFAGPEAVLAYLSRYTHRVAIANRPKTT